MCSLMLICLENEGGGGRREPGGGRGASTMNLYECFPGEREGEKEERRKLTMSEGDGDMIGVLKR